MRIHLAVVFLVLRLVQCLEGTRRQETAKTPPATNTTVTSPTHSTSKGGGSQERVSSLQSSDDDTTARSLASVVVNDSSNSAGSHSIERKRFADSGPLFYGVTYYPWRSANKSCSQVTDHNIREDFGVLSYLARNIQIFDLYCDFTQTIIEMTSANGMGLLMGLSLDDPSDFQRQKGVLRSLFNGNSGTNMSNVIAITVGRTTMLNKTNKAWFVNALREVSTIVAGANFSSRTSSSDTRIPVTTIDDLPIDDETMADPDLAPYFTIRVLSGKPQSISPKVSDADDVMYSWFKAHKKESPSKRKTIYTEFGYPSDFTGVNSSEKETDKKEEKDDHYFLSSFTRFIATLACFGKMQPPPHPGFGPGPGHGPHRRHTEGMSEPEAWPEPPPPDLAFTPQFKYFYHSAFDMPFEYSENDARFHWGLAEYDTRQPKKYLKMALHHLGPEFGSPQFCAKGPPRPDDEPRPPDSSDAVRQWAAIGISLSLAALAVIALVIFLCYRHQRAVAAQRNKLQQHEASVSNSNAYVAALAHYFNNRSFDTYTEIISRSDYEDLAALVRPEVLIEESALKFEEIIGEGHFGIVQRATLSRDGSTMDVAIKKLHVGARNVRRFLSEGILMEQFHHEHVLPLIGISFTSSYLPMIVTPFMEKGDLLSFVKNSQNRLTVRQLLTFGLEISEGVQYMHNLKLIHRDLAARNCMLDEKLTVKIADFGLCRDISDSESYHTARAGDIPLRWMPPETIEKLEWTHKSDVWSYGVVLWELFTRGKQPYARVPLVELRAYLKSGGRLQKPEGCPDLIYDLLKSCWHGQAEQRPSFAHLCQLIPSLVQALERDQILDVCDYYNSISVVELVEQQERFEKNECRPSVSADK